MKKTNWRALLSLSTLIFYSLSVSAQYEISDSTVISHIQYIQRMLNHDKGSTRRWWYGWLTGYSAATLGQASIAYFSDDKRLRQDMILGAASTSMGVIGQFISPVFPGNEADSLNCLPGDSPENRFAKLNHAEYLLKKAAFREKEAWSWKTHAACGAVNLGCGLITWFGYKRTVWDGLKIFALNMTISEMQIWTLPSRALKDYKEYYRAYKPSEKPFVCKPELKWSVAVCPGAIQIKLEF